MKVEKTNALTLGTPEGVHFDLKLAGPVTRSLAWAIDLAAALVVTQFLNSLIMALGAVVYDVASAFTTLVYFAVSIGYSIVLEWYWQGRTIGKRLLRLRVMDVHGLRLRFSQVVVRNLLRFVDTLPVFYMVGGLACLISPRSQRLGDIAANTIVVWTPKTRRSDLDQVLSGKFNSFDDYPHLEARLRQRVSPEQADVALQALLRREGLDPVARIELFRDVASCFRSLVEFPQEATDGISDEQYVRNVVDVLFRKKMS